MNLNFKAYEVTEIEIGEDEQRKNKDKWNALKLVEVQDVAPLKVASKKNNNKKIGTL